MTQMERDPVFKSLNIYTNNTIPIKIPIVFSIEIYKTILKFIYNFKDQIAIAIKRKQNFIHTTWFQSIEASYSNQDSKVLG